MFLTGFTSLCSYLFFLNQSPFPSLCTFIVFHLTIDKVLLINPYANVFKFNVYDED